MRVSYLNNLYGYKSNKNFKSSVQLTAGSRKPDNNQNKKKFSVADIAYWAIIANTLLVNPTINKFSSDKKEQELEQYVQDKASAEIFEQLTEDTEKISNTSNAFYHLNLFNKTEVPALRKISNNFYNANFKTADKEINMTISTKNLDDNIAKGEIISKDNKTIDSYSYKIIFKNSDSNTFDIELRSQNDSAAIKRTFERDKSGVLYLINENNKKVPVNLYSIERLVEKDAIEKSKKAGELIYHDFQEFNYLLCFIATIFQMLRYSALQRKEQE